MKLDSLSSSFANPSKPPEANSSSHSLNLYNITFHSTGSELITPIFDMTAKLENNGCSDELHCRIFLRTLLICPVTSCLSTAECLRLGHTTTRSHCVYEEEVNGKQKAAGLTHQGCIKPRTTYQPAFTTSHRDEETICFSNG